MITLSIVNQKGGVAKTATATALCDGLARRGFRTLAIDLDPQAQLSAAFRAYASDMDYPPAARLFARQPMLDLINISPNLAIVSSGVGLERCNMDLINKVAREGILKKTLHCVQGFDFAIIDTNPSLSIVTLNALAASDYVIVPFKPEFQSIKGVDTLVDTVAALQQSGYKTDILGFLATMADRRRLSTKQVLDYIGEYAKDNGTRLFNAVIRTSVTVADAPGRGKTIYEYRPNSPVARDYETFTDEVLMLLQTKTV